MKDLLKSLNPAQREAVKALRGPVLILAGAGSGKTKTLTTRVAYLIRQKKADPSEILAVTFTNKAAGEMRERVKRLLGVRSDRQLNISTFHSLCVRILRREIEQLGRQRSFTILDEDEQLTAVKQAMRELNVDPQKYAAGAILSYISSAKSELIEPIAYAKLARGYFQQLVATIYPKYQAALIKNNSVDFDDLLLLTVKLFNQEPAILARYQKLFKYVMVDEYQDTNTAQYQLTKLLTDSHHNLFVVGDDWQCLPPTTKVLTPKGFRSIQQISRQDKIVCASGRSDHNQFEVTTVGKRKYQGPVLTVTTQKGRQVTATPNHIFFARLSETSLKHYVYLMYSARKGYRIGIVKGIRQSGKKYDCGLRVRCNQERADKMWILKICDSRPEAKYFEDYFSYKYGLPMTVFLNVPGRSMLYQQKYIDKLYAEIDTEQRANALMQDLLIDKNFPHFVPSAVTPKHRDARKIINLTMFGDARKTARSPWCASRFSIQSSDNQLKNKLEQLGFKVRKAKNTTWRMENIDLNPQNFNNLVRKLQAIAPEAIINESAFVTKNKFQFQPAAHLRPDMIVPIWADNKIIEDKIKSVLVENYQGDVFDLNVDKVHNFITDGFVVHNSIYSWRGANYRNILNFNRDYPQTKIIKLEENYRSTQTILDAAGAVIEPNQNRSQKELWTKGSKGEPIAIVNMPNEQHEGAFIIEEIARQRLTHPELTLNDFVVLYRTNAQSRSLEEACLRAGLAYRIVGGVRFYDRKEIRDVLAYLRIIANPQDELSLQRIINVPIRGIGEKGWERLSEFARGQSANLGEILESVPVGGKARLELSNLANTLKRARSWKKNLSSLFDFILSQTGYLNFLNDKTIEGETQIENVKELKSVVEKYDHLEVSLALQTFLEEVSLIQDTDSYHTDSEAVTLMTIHSAKGLEFDSVFIAGMEENLFPHSRSLLDREELEEERRLCYVGITRAKRRVYLLYTTQRLLYGNLMNNSPSRFLNNIPVALTISGSEALRSPAPTSEKSPSLLKLKTGDLVEHAHFGVGSVIRTTPDEVVVLFGKLGVKRLARELAPLKKLIIS